MRNKNESHWRTASKRIISEIVQRNHGNIKMIRFELKEAYPFGERRYYPYKIWLQECQKAIGKVRYDRKQRRLIEW